LKVLSKNTYGKVMLAEEKHSRKKKVVTIRVKNQMELSKFPAPKKPFVAFGPLWEGTFQTKDRIVWVEDNQGTMTLFDHLSAKKVLMEEEARFYAAELVVHIKDCHEAGVRLVGLRLDGVSIGSDGHIVVRDGGGWLLAHDKDTLAMSDATYTAPETVNDRWSLEVSDWYKLGVFVYEMMCGRLPFYNRDLETLYNLILDEPPRFPSRLTPVAKHFLNSLLAKDPTARLGSKGDFQSVMDHEFFQSVNWDDAAKRRLQPPFVPAGSDSQTDGSFQFEPVED